MKYNLFVRGYSHIRVASVTSDVLPREGEVVTYNVDNGENMYLRVVEVKHHVEGTHTIESPTSSVGVFTEPYRLKTLREARVSADPATRAAFQGAMIDECLEGLEPDFVAGQMTPKEIARIYESFKLRMEKQGQPI